MQSSCHKAALGHSVGNGLEGSGERRSKKAPAVIHRTGNWGLDNRFKRLHLGQWIELGERGVVKEESI